MLYKLYNSNKYNLKKKQLQVKSGFVGSYVLWQYTLTKNKVSLSVELTFALAKIQSFCKVRHS